MKNLLLKWLLGPEIRRGRLPEKQYYDAMSKLYQNPAVMEYLNDREVYLIGEGMAKFIKGQPDKAERLAGQLLEVKALRNRAKMCYARRHKRQ